ncbi:MAG: OmpA family protein [Syntrophales bacterium LBB04]|nr:OmpA family protein [Syntrophales bacterium LBB04]
MVVKKRRKKHDAAHGGAWKDAYADFITALMAFFLVMWLLAMVAPQKRAAMAEYFREYSVFKESGKSFMEGTAQVLRPADQGFKQSPQDTSKGSGGGRLTSENLVSKLKAAIDEKLKSVKNQVLVDIIEGGVRVQIIDSEGSMMFPLGSAEPTPKAKEILRLVTENIANIDNRIAIEGHTDAAPFKGAQTTNWELSTARASAARRELENNGIASGQIARVVGYADQELFVPDNPRDPRNRRISVIVPQEKAKPPANQETPILPAP